MKKADDYIIRLEKRAYESIDKIERGGDQSAKYEYLEIMTTLAFHILDSLRTIRITFCLMAGAFFYLMLKLILMI